MARTKNRQADANSKLALAQRLAEATALQQKGAAGPAERLYREMLAADPNQADALHNLGVICAQSSRLDEALDLIQRSLALKPDFAAAHNSLGIVFRRMGRGADAIANYERALDLDPSYVDACQNLGLALRLAGRFDEAVVRLGDVVRKKPASPDAQFNLGQALKDAGHVEAAMTAFREAIRLRPDHAESQRALGAALLQTGKNDEALIAYECALALKPDQPELLSQIGNLLVGQDRLDEAKSAFRRAVALKPNSPELLCNLGVALNNMELSDEAIESFNRALELRPDFAEALTNLGVALQVVGRLAEADTVLTRAVALKPDLAAAHTNLGMLRGTQDRVDEAIACYRHAISLQIDAMEAHQNLCAVLLMHGQVDDAIEAGRRAIEISPNHHASRFNLSTALLTAGEFAEGWEDYEARPSHKEAGRRLKHGPLWRLEAPRGSRVLVYSEQGLGDSIHFARYVRLVEARGDRVVLETRGPLRRLMSSLGKATLIEPNEPVPEVDYQISLVSLPRAFGTRLDTIPADVPYLRANENDVARFRARFAGEKLSIGLVWRGNPNHKNDRNRSLDPTLLGPLFNVDGVRFVSLQKQPRDGDLDLLRRLGPIEDPTSELKDFADTAALIEALDLVISVDTSVAHLAGALAKPVWILLPSSGDWRWLIDREDSPWYPTARLFRQASYRDWPSVIERVAAALREKAAHAPVREGVAPPGWCRIPSWRPSRISRRAVSRRRERFMTGSLSASPLTWRPYSELCGNLGDDD